MTALDEAHQVFRRWLGNEYDTDALDAVLAAAAVDQLDGDPLWLLLISGSGNAKTETVVSLAQRARITSTLTSDAALLSATAKKERAADATGGLLREMGDRGVLIIKDVTSIISMNRDMRATVLAALREVYDGSWTRETGVDGGKRFHWSGRITIIGAVTTVWDQAHEVISQMGDRFVLLRVDSSNTTGRIAAGRQAIGNTGHEKAMRADLANAAEKVLAQVPSVATELTSSDTELLLRAANVVTLARTAVIRDYRGDVIDAHAPETPTRFAKQLAQVVRGGVAIGIGHHQAVKLAVRCARDSMPPLRLLLLDDIATHPGASVAEARKRIGKPRPTINRELQALEMLGLLESDEEDTIVAGHPGSIWRYRIAEGIDATSLQPDTVPEMSLGDCAEPQSPPLLTKNKRCTDISGTQPTTQPEAK